MERGVPNVESRSGTNKAGASGNPRQGGDRSYRLRLTSEGSYF